MIRYDTLLFPGGLRRAFTLSYDDGVTQDRRLAALFRDCGLKCTFNLNSGLYGHCFSKRWRAWRRTPWTRSTWARSWGATA